MRQILSNNVRIFNHHIFHNATTKINSTFITSNTIKINYQIQKAMQFQFKLRCINKPEQIYKYIQQNKQQIKKYGKTILMDYLNQYPMQSFLRSREQLDAGNRQHKKQTRLNIYRFLDELDNMKDYEVFLKFSIYQKVHKYIGYVPDIYKRMQQCELQINKIFETGRVDLPDAINWLCLVNTNCKQDHIIKGFDIIERQLLKQQNKLYLQNNRGITILIKRMIQTDWSSFRKYKNIIKFMTFNASFQEYQSNQQIIIILERILQMKLHLLGEKNLPKIVDQIFTRFDRDFDLIKENKQTLLKIFHMFKYLPLSYNRTLYNRIHNHLKNAKDLPSHLLIYLPYNKLSVNEVSFLQNKMFASGREDICLKLIYTIYSSNYREIFTPMLTQQAYNNLFDLWKKQSTQYLRSYQIYFSLIFRFMRMKSKIIEHHKLKALFQKIIQKAEIIEYNFLKSLSFVSMITLLQIYHHFGLSTNFSELIRKMQEIIKYRRNKNVTADFNDMLLEAIRVHHNTQSKRSVDILTSFIYSLINNPELLFHKKCQLLFLIQKTQRPDPRWINLSKKISEELLINIQPFIEIYIIYEHKTVKLTNYMFMKLEQKKIYFDLISELISSLNLKLLTSLKGKLLNPLKKYLNQLNFISFDISKSNLNSLIQTYRLLFYFKHQISEFMQFYSIKLIQQINKRSNSQEYINGKQFASFCVYIMQVLKDLQISLKVDVIESISSILKSLRKKQGIYLKVFEFNFLWNNRKYIKLNQQVLQHQSRQIIETLTKTQKTEQHKDLYLIILKLHCLDYLQLNNFNIRLFADNCIQMVENSSLNLNQIKQCLGFQILNCQNSEQIQKIKLILTDIIKLSFRKYNTKQNYFVYEYFLKFFGKIKSKQLIIEVCDKLLYEKLYPIQLSNIIPILNTNSIKLPRFNKRIFQIIKLSQAYITFQKMQVLSWLQKIQYQLETDLNLNTIKQKINDQIVQKTSDMKFKMKSIIQNQAEEKNQEKGYEVEDEDFDRNYKNFIDYAWIALKNKQVHTKHFKFITRYLFFNLQKIHKSLQNLQVKHLISKTKIYHLLKYIRLCKFFDIQKQTQKLSDTFEARKQVKLDKRTKKLNLLKRIQKDLECMVLQRSQILQNKLNGLSYQLQFKPTHRVKNEHKYMKVEYLITKKSQKTKETSKFVIHTVKDYHMTKQDIDVNTELQKMSITKNHGIKYQSMSRKQPEEIIQFKDEEQFLIEQSELSLEMQPEKQSIFEKELWSQDITRKPKRQNKLFGASKPKVSIPTPSVAKSQQIKIEQLTLDNYYKQLLKIESLPSNPSLYKDYNGYLKVEKSLIQLVTGLKCVIFDQKTGNFFQ